MPNYVAHELFGARVRENLSETMRSVVDEEPVAFRCGLYGPDPLLFLPGGLSLSRRLHGNWKEQSGAAMQQGLQEGNAGQQSFAAGYLCHLLLDDACHQRIYALMREQGLSHRIMEIGLDWRILTDLGKERFPAPSVPGKKRMGGLATELMSPVKSSEYRAGLSGMGLICRQMNKVGRYYRSKLTGDYRAPVSELYDILESKVSDAVLWIEGMAEGRMLPGSVLAGA